MKLPCLKAEWPRNLPICGGDCHSMERTSRCEPMEQLLVGLDFPSLTPGPSLDAVQSLQPGAIAK